MPLHDAMCHFQTSSRVRAAPSSCAQFFQYALHSLQAIWVGWSELRMHFEVSQCLLQTALLLPRNAAVVVAWASFGSSRIAWSKSAIAWSKSAIARSTSPLVPQALPRLT